MVFDLVDPSVVSVAFVFFVGGAVEVDDNHDYGCRHDGQDNLDNSEKYVGNSGLQLITSQSFLLQRPRFGDRQQGLQLHLGRLRSELPDCPP